MSSSGISATNSGPLVIRTYLGSSINNTYLVTDYEKPVSSNYVLITSTNGVLAPSDNIYISSIGVSSIVASSANISSLNVSSMIGENVWISSLNVSSMICETGLISTSYLSSVYSVASSITMFNTLTLNNPSNGNALLVNGSTVFTEPGAPNTSEGCNISIWGLSSGDPINESFSTTQTYTINSTISKINFSLIGSGGASTFSNPSLSTQDLPGVGAYIGGTLAVKQGDMLHFTIGGLGTLNSSGGTSLVYLSSIGGGIYISSLVCVAGAGGGNGYAPDAISSSSGGGHGGGGNGSIALGGPTDYYVAGTSGYDGISTINGIYVSDTDGGQGGQQSAGGTGGGGAMAGSNPDTTDIYGTGGIVGGGQGQIDIYTGGWGGGGYSGGGGGGASARTSAGGGGGATYIATSTLSSILSDVVCLGGQWISNNNASPMGLNYGLPNKPGYALISGYSPNDTLFTNGDIQCRVLRYEQLDPPINAIGGSAALWALYPAIDIVHMNDNPIVECGGLEVDSGGVDVTGNSIFRNTLSTLDILTVSSGGADVTGDSIFRNKLSTFDTLTVSSGGLNVKNKISLYAGADDTCNSGMNEFIRSTSSGTRSIDYLVAGDPSGCFGTGTWQDTRYVYNNADVLQPVTQVWSIVMSSNITPVGSTIGDIHFYNNIYIDKKLGVGTINPITKLDVDGDLKILTTAYLPNISSNVISSGIGLYDILSSNIISSNSLYSNNIYANSISSGIGLYDVLSSNIISSNSLYSNNIYANSISSFELSLNSLSTNVISSGLGVFSTLTSNNTLSLVSNSEIRCIADGSNNLGFISQPLNETLGSGAISIRNGLNSVKPVSYTIYNASQTGGGLTAGNLMIYSYSSINITKCVDISPDVSSIIVGNSNISGGSNLMIDGTSGLSRVYDTVYNPPEVVGNWSLYPATNTVNINDNLITNCSTIQMNTNGNINLNNVLNLNSTSNTIFKNINTLDSNNTYYYKYWVTPQSPTGARLSGNGYWYNGTYVSLTPLGSGYASTLLSNSNQFWNCPRSGVWTVQTDIYVPYVPSVGPGGGELVNQSHVVTGNYNRQEIITANGSSATVFIQQGEQILTCGFIGAGNSAFNPIGDNSNISNVSFRLIMPLSITV